MKVLFYILWKDLNKHEFFLATPNNVATEERILFLSCIIKPSNYLSLVMPSFSIEDRKWYKSSVGAAVISSVGITSFGPQVSSRSYLFEWYQQCLHFK